jgi:hypothetical protein
MQPNWVGGPCCMCEQKTQFEQNAADENEDGDGEDANRFLS